VAYHAVVGLGGMYGALASLLVQPCRFRSAVSDRSAQPKTVWILPCLHLRSVESLCLASTLSMQHECSCNGGTA
jgi:hypothetical protein